MKQQVILGPNSVEEIEVSFATDHRGIFGVKVVLGRYGRVLHD
jgi:hypothetical protein